ncbi:MAG TPA: phosphoribosylanthranilate isomerase [Candidatus Dormibacteraeota bacterium]|nr:phosphoribosylanthranilate isomerase [Candidatus Dormibacteraeota bacterium]
MAKVIEIGPHEIWPAPGWPRLGARSPDGRTRVKICGCTTADEVEAAVAAGADAVGLIFAPSPRRITPEQGALATADVPPDVSVVGVFIDPTPTELEHALAVLPRLMPQFSGSETPQLCRHLGTRYLKVFAVSGDGKQRAQELSTALDQYPDALPIFETASRQRGGSGHTFDWSVVRALVERRPAVISGGLNPGNVGECVRRLRPYAVDVRSGVESAAVKDPAKLGDFISAVRRASATT